MSRGLNPSLCVIPLHCPAHLPVSKKERSSQLLSPLLAANTKNQPGLALTSLQVTRRSQAKCGRLG